MKRFIDSNVLLDIFSHDPAWAGWSESQILPFAGRPGSLVINGIVYAEISVGFSDCETLDRVLSELGITSQEPSRTALFAAGKAFAAYRRRSGNRSTILPDFLIGAHAAQLGIPLVTRDPRRFRTYFPDLSLVAPEP